MADHSWPTVGQMATSIPSHAAIIKGDIENLQERISQGASSIPSEVFSQLSSSIVDLLDKLTDQPSLKDVMNAVNRVEQNTRALLEKSASTQALAPKTLTSLHRQVEMPLSEQGLWNGLTADDLDQKLPSSCSEPVDHGLIFSAEPSSSRLILHDNNSKEGSVHGKIYAPLNKSKSEIRVVTILPSSQTDFDISCTFAVVSLDDDPTYKALSYTWGDPQDTLPITLNGHRFDVARNLKRALQRLRYLDSQTPIWIDAICINQVDMEERMHQVQLMRSIYEKPGEVIVYLGEPSSPFPITPGQTSTELPWDARQFTWTGDQSDIPKINEILRYAQRYADTYPDLPDKRAANPLMLAMCFMRLLAGDVHLKDISLLGNANIRAVCIGAFQTLIMQPWWNRIWVVQEVVLPPAVTVIFGSFTAPLSMYASASTHLSRHHTTCCSNFLPSSDSRYACLDDYCHKMQTIIESGRLWTEKAPATLMTLLRLYYPKDATDPRDKIYGLLGLVREWGPEQIKPDYTISGSELYTKVALHSISVTQTLEFLDFKANKILEKAQYYDAIDAIRSGILYYMPLPKGADFDLKYDKKEAMKKGKPVPMELPYSSWAPDWARLNDLGSEVGVAERINRALMFNASGGRPAFFPPKPLYTSDPALTRSALLPVSILRIGKVLGEVRGQGDYRMPFLVHDNATITTTEDFPLPVQPNKRLLRPYPMGGGTQYDAICRAVCGDTFFASSVTPSAASRVGSEAMFRRATQHDIESVKLWRKWMHRGRVGEYGGYAPPNPKDFEDEEEYARVVEANRAIRSVGFLRRAIELDTGHVGMAADAQERDEVVIIMGARTPFAIRKLGELGVEGGGKMMVYILVGECYLVGGMDGELVEKMEEIGKMTEEICLL